MGWRPTTPKNTCRFFLFLSLWFPHGHLASSYTLVHCKRATHLVFLLSVFCFYYFWWLCFFVSMFVFIVFFVFDSVVSFSCIFSLCDPKKPDQITEYLKCSFSCSVLVPASSQFHLAQLRTPTRPREPPLKMVLNNVLKYLFLQCFLNINQNFPQNGP